MYQFQHPQSALWVRESSAHLAATSQGFHRTGKFFSSSSSTFIERRVGVLVWGAFFFFFRLKLLLWFLIHRWPWVISAWVSSTVNVHQHLAGRFAEHAGRFVSLQDFPLGRDVMSSGETGWLRRSPAAPRCITTNQPRVWLIVILMI